jgi:hypothetical protein
MNDELEFDFASIDWRPWLSASIFLTVMLYYGVTWWKALIVTAILLLAAILQFGRRVVLMGGIILLFAALGVWIDAISDPSTWKLSARKAIEASSIATLVR